MKKRMIWAGALCLTALLCVGCGGKPETQQPNNSAEEQTPIVYSNLLDHEAQKEVAQLLEAQGITQEQTDTLMAWANDFNGRVTSGTLAKGFQDMKETGADYGGLIIESKEGEDGWLYPEANCRLTSYLLMKHQIQTNGTYADNDTYLVFDVEAVDTYEPFQLSGEERSDFMSLFNWVPVEGASTLKEHVARIQKAWTEREIQIQEGSPSLITVYVHSPFDQVRFVGHTGVLLETEEGLLFVEKYGPQLPFQATKFHDREELKRYLLGRADLYGDETELPPIVMENNQVL